MSKEEKSFTATEVGTLIESFRNDLSAVASEVGGLMEWRGTVDSRLENIESRLIACEDGLRIAIPAADSSRFERSRRLR